MNADEIGTKVAGASLDGIVTSAQHRDRVTYLMRNGARAAAVVPVMMVSTSGSATRRFCGSPKMASRYISVLPAPRPEVKISIRGDHIGSVSRLAGSSWKGRCPSSPPAWRDARLARELVQESVRVLRQSGYEVAEDRAEDGGRSAASTGTGRYRLRRPYASRA